MKKFISYAKIVFRNNYQLSDRPAVEKIVWHQTFSPAAGKSIPSSLRPPETVCFPDRESRFSLRFYKGFAPGGGFHMKNRGASRAEDLNSPELL